MKRIAWVVVLCAAVSGCKGKAKDAGGGSAGSAAGSAGSAMAAPADAAVAVDAAAPEAALPTTISTEGVGPINATTAPDKLASLFPGWERTSEEQEAEDMHVEWITLSKDKKRVLKLLVDHMTGGGPMTVSRVLVHHQMFATASGIHVGSTGADFAAKYADATCELAKFDGEKEKSLFCEAKSAPQLHFYFDAKGFKGKLGKTKLAALEALAINQIMWNAPEPKEKD